MHHFKTFGLFRCCNISNTSSLLSIFNLCCFGWYVKICYRSLLPFFFLKKIECLNLIFSEWHCGYTELSTWYSWSVKVTLSVQSILGPFCSISCWILWAPLWKGLHLRISPLVILDIEGKFMSTNSHVCWVLRPSGFWARSVTISLVPWRYGFGYL